MLMFVVAVGIAQEGLVILTQLERDQFQQTPTGIGFEVLVGGARVGTGGDLCEQNLPEGDQILELFLPGTEPTEFCDRDDFRLFRTPTGQERSR